MNDSNMTPAEARNVLEKEIKRDRGGSAGLDDSIGGETITLRDHQGSDTERSAENPHISLPVDSDDDDFVLPSGQAKPIADNTTLWKVNIKFYIGVSIHFCLFKYLPPRTTSHNDLSAPAKKRFADRILKCVKPPGKKLGENLISS